ncbi:porin [Beijerinckia sp. L45]|uniref:porin n=1 Tax=Beijerinckia sp. L45 TaxID=1641855 RepID=UPI00131AEC4A|nr:porin [Beijerinckia sp. L45]
MTSFLNYASSSLLGSFVMIAAAGGSGHAAEYGTTRFVSNANRCAAYGPEFAAVEGSDTCMRIGGHVRVQMGTNAGLRPSSGWGAGSASAATLRSDSADPRTGAATHLRVRGGLEYPNPF